MPPPGTPINAEGVATSVTVGSDGAYYVGELRGFPATPGTSEVWRIEPDSVDAVCDPENPARRATATLYADGFTSIVDLGAGPNGEIYVVELVQAELAAVRARIAEPIGALYRIPAGGGEAHRARTGPPDPPRRTSTSATRVARSWPARSSARGRSSACAERRLASPRSTQVRPRSVHTDRGLSGSQATCGDDHRARQAITRRAVRVPAPRTAREVTSPSDHDERTRAPRRERRRGDEHGPYARSSSASTPASPDAERDRAPADHPRRRVDAAEQMLRGHVLPDRRDQHSPDARPGTGDDEPATVGQTPSPSAAGATSSTVPTQSTTSSARDAQPTAQRLDGRGRDQPADRHRGEHEPVRAWARGRAGPGDTACTTNTPTQAAQTRFMPAVTSVIEPEHRVPPERDQTGSDSVIGCDSWRPGCSARRSPVRPWWPATPGD